MPNTRSPPRKSAWGPSTKLLTQRLVIDLQSDLLIQRQRRSARSDNSDQRCCLTNGEVLTTPSGARRLRRVPCMALLGGMDLTRGSLCHHIPVVLNVVSEAVCRDGPKPRLLKILARLCLRPTSHRDLPRPAPAIPSCNACKRPCKAASRSDARCPCEHGWSR